MIALVDYGAGNLASVKKALSTLEIPFFVPSAPAELHQANGIVIPGVGHFDTTKSLTKEWRDEIRREADNRLPVLGICVGLQWLFEGSAEAPAVGGLGVFAGACFDLRDHATGLKVPHVGWNSLEIDRPSALMHGIASGTQVYFTHSYAAPVTAQTVAACEYGARFAAAVEDRNVAAVQFHPEKSGDAGLKILKNFFTRVQA